MGVGKAKAHQTRKGDREKGEKVPQGGGGGEKLRTNDKGGTSGGALVTDQSILDVNEEGKG